MRLLKKPAMRRPNCWESLENKPDHETSVIKLGTVNAALGVVKDVTTAVAMSPNEVTVAQTRKIVPAALPTYAYRRSSDAFRTMCEHLRVRQKFEIQSRASNSEQHTEAIHFENTERFTEPEAATGGTTDGAQLVIWGRGFPTDSPDVGSDGWWLRSEIGRGFPTDSPDVGSR